MELVEEITDNTDNNLVTTGVFIDLKKAFDTINHTMLIEKLKHYGIRGVASNWIENYLCNITQYVSYNDVQSDYKSVVCGIPQGSILGPLLFVLYINDLDNVSKKLKFVLFADDTNVFYTDKSLEKVTKVLNKELECMSIWFKVNKLSLNVEKTNYMIFKNNANNVNHKISINGIDIKRVNVTKVLCVHVDDK